MLHVWEVDSTKYIIGSAEQGAARRMDERRDNNQMLSNNQTLSNNNMSTDAIKTKEKEAFLQEAFLQERTVRLAEEKAALLETYRSLRLQRSTAREKTRRSNILKLMANSTDDTEQKQKQNAHSSDNSAKEMGGVSQSSSKSGSQSGSKSGSQSGSQSGSHSVSQLSRAEAEKIANQIDSEENELYERSAEYINMETERKRLLQPRPERMGVPTDYCATETTLDNLEPGTKKNLLCLAFLLYI
jgi:hypothetical protein